MNQVVFISIVLSTFLILFSCEKNTQTNKNIHKKWIPKNLELRPQGDQEASERVTSLQIENYADFSDLVTAIDSVNCTPVTLKLDFYNGVKIDSFLPTTACIGKQIKHVKTRNILIIHNDKILYGNDLLPLDKLESEVLKHLNNQGEIPSYSENPESFFIRISYGEYSLRKLPELLGRLKVLYDAHSDLYKSKLEFARHIFPPSLSSKNNT